MSKNEGYIHLYTGDGKGKTTAAIGLAVRAAGAGKKVFIAQFAKGMHYSELKTLKKISEIEVVQYGLKCFIKGEPTLEDIEAARKGFEYVSAVIRENRYDIVILDEICIAVHFKLLDKKEVLKLLIDKPGKMEIILTGRKAPPEFFEVAGLVTEMKEIKHYFRNGVYGRKGIEC